MTELSMCEELIKMWTWMAANPGKEKEDYEMAIGIDLKKYYHRCPACEYYLYNGHGGCRACPLKSCEEGSPFGRWWRGDHSGAVEILTRFIERRMELLGNKKGEKPKKLTFARNKNYVFVDTDGEPFLLAGRENEGFRFHSFRRSGNIYSHAKPSGQECLDYHAERGAVYEFTGCIPAIEFFLEKRREYEKAQDD